MSDEMFEVLDQVIRIPEREGKEEISLRELNKEAWGQSEGEVYTDLEKLEDLGFVELSKRKNKLFAKPLVGSLKDVPDLRDGHIRGTIIREELNKQFKKFEGDDRGLDELKEDLLKNLSERINENYY